MCSPEQGADCFLRSAALSRLFFILSPSRHVCGKEVLKEAGPFVEVQTDLLQGSQNRARQAGGYFLQRSWSICQSSVRRDRQQAVLYEISLPYCNSGSVFFFDCPTLSE